MKGGREKWECLIQLGQDDRGYSAGRGMKRSTQLAQVRRSLNPQRLASGVATLSLGIGIGLIPNLIAPAALPWVASGAGSVLLLSSAASAALSRKSVIETSLQSPLAIRSSEDEGLYARKGLIGFVSLYKNSALSKDELKAAIATLDFDRLDLENSNLKPMIQAIQTHSQKLEHCWLLSTIGGNQEKAPGSLPYAKVVAEYLRQRKGVQCKFYYGAAYAISLDDDTNVLKKTYDLLVKRIFQEAFQFGLLPQDLVADCTAGFRSLTLGMVLACLDKERDIEFMGTRYDENGNVTQELTPIIFSFEPQLKPNDR